MMVTASSSRERPRIAPYWFAIALVGLFAIALFLYHLISGTTPSRVALHIEVLDFEIYWYGIWIIGGVALGCWVVAAIAAERALAVLDQTVPQEIQQQPLSYLDLPDGLEQELDKRGVKNTGEFLYLWGLDPRNLGIKKKEVAGIQEVLETVPVFDGVLGATGQPAVTHRWVPCRQIPETDAWFETAWAEYREGEIYD